MVTIARRGLAKTIKKFRKEHNLSQMEFGMECGISDVTICRIERQNTNVSLDTLELLAAYMGVGVGDLFPEDTLLP